MKTTDLELFYKKCVQYCYVKYGTEPSEIQIDETGKIIAEWHSYYDRDAEYEYFFIEDLEQDLNKVYEERKIKEEEDRLKQEKHNREMQKVRDNEEKEKRKLQYIKLKKEFD